MAIMTRTEMLVSMIRNAVRSLSTLPPLTAQHYDIKRGNYSKVMVTV